MATPRQQMTKRTTTPTRPAARAQRVPGGWEWKKQAGGAGAVVRSLPAKTPRRRTFSRVLAKLARKWSGQLSNLSADCLPPRFPLPPTRCFTRCFTKDLVQAVRQLCARTKK
ncbi:hypothetical protein Dda_9202 [Drechslerella dactyloides]|uniref:Uncharacterized protein n=1 Tax=Drechslerella dactyloides TaxID=74499 RepID=A0AAD6IRA7_DREDA|nr:hypothetical protein Dda_9202 [Drechslerella dactyloides]